jgi:hypothetical protein
LSRIDQVAPLAGGHGVQELAIRVEDFDLQVAENVPLFLVVSDHGVVSRRSSAGNGTSSLA